MAGSDATDALTCERTLLEEAVRAAGARALEFYGGKARVWEKDNNTPVSEADLAADAVLKERLLGARPSYGWVSEESGRERARGPRARFWVVDPIDGTSAFLKQRAEWTVSVALVEEGRPVLGAVFNPVTGEYFDAARAQGAALNGEAITVTSRGVLEGANVIAFSNGLHSQRWRLAWPELRIRPVNSMAYRLCLVASGAFDATISSSGKSDWDIAAADLIVHEAGGVVSSFAGTPFVYDKEAARHPNVLAAGPALHARMLEHIGQSWQG